VIYNKGGAKTRVFFQRKRKKNWFKKKKERLRGIKKTNKVETGVTEKRKTTMVTYPTKCKKQAVGKGPGKNKKNRKTWLRTTFNRMRQESPKRGRAIQQTRKKIKNKRKAD